MGCSSCGTKPGGCKSNGGCSSGGCNRFNVHNWLNNIPAADFGKPYNIIEISFNNGSRKGFYKNTTFHFFEKGDFVSVEGVGGFDVGTVSLTGELVKLQMRKRNVKEDSEEVKKILRISTPDDISRWELAKGREKDMLIRARVISRDLKLDMKITEVELQADAKKATFFYIAEERVDFRDLIKRYATDFNVKVEMKQIGIRQEAGKVGGIGSCGRELCCSTWLTDFKAVSTVAARYQNLSINQTKLSGQCGRLKCCLNYELDTYMDSLRNFPNDCDKLEIASGMAFLQRKDIFHDLMWYSFAGSTKQYPITLDRAREIKQLNQQGKKPEEIGEAEIEGRVNKQEKDEAYVDVVGAISLKSLEKKDRNQRYKQNNNKGKSNNNPQHNRPQGPPKPGGAANTNKPQGNNNSNRPKAGTNNPQGQGGNTKPNNSAKPAPNNNRPQGGGNKPKPNNKPPQNNENSGA
jgi:cell fate regulator YaaT (PSP1 superfamily)